MRWKLLLIASAAAAVAGVVASLGLATLAGVDPTGERPASGYGLAAAGVLAAPILAVVGAGVFVYRHTPRRRPLQAAATVLASSALTLAALYVAFLLLARHDTPTEPRPAPAPETTTLRPSTTGPRKAIL